jgi:hypothetical protein
MKITELPSVLCKREAKLKEVSVGNMREIISILSDLIFQNSELTTLLFRNGERRSKKKKKK